jgi:hypothetical protein
LCACLLVRFLALLFAMLRSALLRVAPGFTSLRLPAFVKCSEHCDYQNINNNFTAGVFLLLNKVTGTNNSATPSLSSGSLIMSPMPLFRRMSCGPKICP